MFLHDYDLAWDNHSGSQMGPANMLSCCDMVNTFLDYTAIILLLSGSDVLICALDVELADKIAHFTATNLLVKDATDAMSKHSSLFLHAACKDWTFLNSALYYRSCLYILEPAQQDLVCFLHCSLVG